MTFLKEGEKVAGPVKWTCLACTVENAEGAAACECCGTPNPNAGGDGDEGGGEGGEGGEGGDEEEDDDDEDWDDAAEGGVGGAAEDDVGLQQFDEWMNRSDWWPIAVDTQLVQLVNTLCDRNSAAPGHLVPDEVAEAASAYTLLKDVPRDAIICRVAALLCLNQKVDALLPLTNLQIQRKSAIETSDRDLVFASSLGRRVATLRGVIFKHTKMKLWKEVLASTTKDTPPPEDEYEKPSGIPEIRLNRIQASTLVMKEKGRAYALTHSVFGQLFTALDTKPDSQYRKAFVDSQDEGQERCFYVNFVGEGADDHGGPYRAIFQTACCDEADGPLRLFKPCPDSLSKDKMMFNERVGSVGGYAPALSLFTFLGKLVGIAVRHRMQVGLNLPSMLWRPMVGLPARRVDLERVDMGVAKALDDLENAEKLASMSQEELCELFELQLERMHVSEESGGVDDKGKNSTGAGGTDEQGGKGTAHHLVDDDGHVRPLRRRQQARAATSKEGEEAEEDDLSLNFDNVGEFVRLVERRLLQQSAPQLEAFMDGLGAVLPAELFALFTPKELELLICGRPEIDIELLQSVTDYEDVKEDSEYVYTRCGESVQTQCGNSVTRMTRVCRECAETARRL